MKERSDMIGFLRGELVGPGVPINSPQIIEFAGREFNDVEKAGVYRSGALAWVPSDGAEPQEVIYFERESPHGKYGIGLLSPEQVIEDDGVIDGVPQAEDELNDAEMTSEEPETGESVEDEGQTPDEERGEPGDGDDHIDVTSTAIRRPSTIGISFCTRLGEGARLVVRLPTAFRFPWQDSDDSPVAVNGRYELCTRSAVREGESARRSAAWRRLPAVDDLASVSFDAADLRSRRKLTAAITMPVGNSMRLFVDAFGRQVQGTSDTFLVTVVLRNATKVGNSVASKEAVLFQTLFSAAVEGGDFVPYPETGRAFSQLDTDEQSLALLYQDSATWAVGHGCSAGWSSEPGETPSLIYADVMPTVETPSMTPDIKSLDGRPIQLKMKELAELPDDGSGPVWHSLNELSREYRAWIAGKRDVAEGLRAELRDVAVRHLDACESCCVRIDAGIALLRADKAVRRAFRLANRSMLLQQIAAKKLKRRPLEWDTSRRCSRVSGDFVRPTDLFGVDVVGDPVGTWRAFQMAFLLTQLSGTSTETHPDREIVDLIWFPTGGGKTEAYLGVIAFYMFHQRLADGGGEDGLASDGTNVLMRYTLRMLTTQQFQRAASLICAMEALRRNPALHFEGEIPGDRFALGLWLGADGSPNKVENAQEEVTRFRKGKIDGNPLVITECPWCRAEIGRVSSSSNPRGPSGAWTLAGISSDARLHCPDSRCDFGQRSQSSWLPIEVIDERIYETRPSMVIATADKFAMLAFRPAAGAIFGRRRSGDRIVQEKRPPGIIVQDELHLIAGPLGTIYGLYEGVVEALCSYQSESGTIRPKIIASTATIRGANEQVRALYARVRSDGSANFSLFPSPGLSMGDSFFGVYKRSEETGRLDSGRLYLGIHATEYGSVQTTQVRTFAAALCRAKQFPTAKQQDPWWTLLAFYNSLRELGGAKTLLDSDIRSRLNFVQSREGIADDARRHIRPAEELTSRLSQAEIVKMLDRLAADLVDSPKEVIDACLASSIIEVGVDIDRLSLMAVVGQPKTTAQYIQVTGRVGRRWWERPGLILTVYSPSKSRDRSHFEQFHSYHRRLYERVEPTSATPYASSAIQRALAGALLVWSRQHSRSNPSPLLDEHREALAFAFNLVASRCEVVQNKNDYERSLKDMQVAYDRLLKAFERSPEAFESFPPSPDKQYLMLWQGQFYTWEQERRGVYVPSSMRQVDSSSELQITSAYTD